MTAEPRKFSRMGGAIHQVGRITLAFKRADGDAAGAYSIAESIEPPGAGASLHRHLSFAETLTVCEGQLTAHPAAVIAGFRAVR